MEFNGRGTPVAGVIVEPIQGEGGDNFASADYFQALQQICLEVTVALCLAAFVA